MFVIILQGKDLFYRGEVVELPEATGREWVGAGFAKEVCPECRAPLVHESGCTSCYSCGYARCG